MGFRPERLGEVIKRDLGRIIQKDYQPEGTFVTVTRVIMSPDLMIAKVYLSVFSPGRDDKVVYEYIDEHIDDIRFKLASRIRNQVRKIPELHFYVDDTAEYVNKMENLLSKLDIPDDPEDAED